MSQLEVGNPRFARKEDLIWYLITVGTAIIVSLVLGKQRSSLIMSSVFSVILAPFFGLHLIYCPHSAVSPTSAVPRIEEDYPCTSTCPSFANNGRLAVWAWWDLDDSSDFTSFARVVFCSLHFLPLASASLSLSPRTGMAVGLTCNRPLTSTSLDRSSISRDSLCRSATHPCRTDEERSRDSSSLLSRLRLFPTACFLQPCS